MENGMGFKRNFYIFANEDTGFDTGQKPTGHVKIEIREGKGRLHAIVQNLRDGKDRFEYVLYLLHSGKDFVEPVRVGRLEAHLSKSELTWTFDPHNVGQSGYPENVFDVIVILAEYADRQGGSVICPLAAYRNNQVQWRNSFMASLMKKKTHHGGDAAEAATEPGTGNVSGSATELATEPATEPGTEAAAGNALENASKAAAMSVAETVTDGTTADNNHVTDNIVAEDPVWGIADDPEQSSQSEQPPHPPQQSTQPSQQPTQPPQTSQQPTQPPQQQVLTGINTGCVYLNGNMCGAFVQNGAATPNPCSTCHVNRGEQPAQEQLPGDLSKLRAMLDNNFEEKDPFRSKRSDYLWWKVTNPVNLNNILYQNNIRSPLMFNPVVMMAHYKYRHLIIGIFTHMNGRKYVVCGVPGMHMVDRKPFGELSTWVQTERSRPQYGAFGYWLVYINPGDGKILNISQQ